LQDLKKFTQIGIWGLKIYHLATLRGVASAEDIFFQTSNRFEVLLYTSRTPGQGLVHEVPYFVGLYI
jgi:hypothetical protein